MGDIKKKRGDRRAEAPSNQNSKDLSTVPQDCRKNFGLKEK